jgi:hypothetical protein
VLPSDQEDLSQDQAPNNDGQRAREMALAAAQNEEPQLMMLLLQPLDARGSPLSLIDTLYLLNFSNYYSILNVLFCLIEVMKHA